MFRQYSEKLKTFPLVAQRFDAAIATFNPTVAWLGSAVKKQPDLVVGYFIQDYEPYFYPEGSDGYQKAFEFYTFLPNIVRLVTTQWIDGEVKEHHNVNSHVVGGYFDTDLHIPRLRSETEWPNRPLRIAAMIGPNSERRSVLG